MNRYVKRILSLFMVCVFIIFPYENLLYGKVSNDTTENNVSDEDISTQEVSGYLNSYVDIDFEIPLRKGAGNDSQVQSNVYSVDSNGTAAIPVKYDSRNVSGVSYVTSVKNQGNYGTCWAFSAMSLAETSLIKKGLYTADQIDLSEYHLSYFMYHEATDPLGNFTGDFSKTSSYLYTGGNHLFTIFSLASWRSAADEAEYKYSDIVADSTLTIADENAFDNVAHMQNGRITSLSGDRNGVKELIMEYGSVSVSYYSYNGTSNNYYNSTTHSYYQNVTSSTNHSVTIVGWDDNYSVTNFNSGCRPENDGAWLIKNSWGSSWGDNGYFWLSYEDLSAQGYVYAFDFEQAGNYDNNYQYDGACGNVARHIERGQSVANVFTVKGEKEQRLSAVSIGLYSTDVDYKIQIYKNPSNEDDPESGTPMLTEEITGTTDYTGYYTIKIDEEITLSPGDKFSVVFTFPNSNVYVFDDEALDYGWIWFNTVSEEKTSFAKLSSTGWYDSGSDDITFRIKAFTDNIGDTKSIENAVVTGVENKAYTGRALTQELTVTVDDTVLEKNTDYILKYTNNINEGIASVIITGIGEYEGTIVRKFIVYALPITELTKNTNTALTYNYGYTGRFLSYTPEDMDEYKFLVLQNSMNFTADIYDSDFNIINTGSGTSVELECPFEKGKTYYIYVYRSSSLSYFGTAIYVKLQGITTYLSLNDAVMDDLGSYEYTGEAIIPDEKIYYGGELLERNVDYTCEYSSNINAGTATLTIRGKGVYIDSITVQYEITPKKVTDCTVTYSSETYYFEGSQIVPSFSVKIGSYSAIPGKDYIYTITQNNGVGVAKNEIVFKGNYQGTIESSFKILPVSGDVTCDGKVSLLDLVKIRRYLAGVESLTEYGKIGADFNGDGKVSILDLVQIRKYLAS